MIRLRPAHSGDAQKLLQWVNMPDCLMQKLRTAEPILAAEHQAWLARRLSDPLTMLRIVEDEGVDVGQVRLQKDGTDYLVDVYVAAEYRGRGFARQALAQAIAELRQADHSASVIAEVRVGNLPSQALFLSLGFQEMARTDERVTFGLLGGPLP